MTHRSTMLIINPTIQFRAWQQYAPVGAAPTSEITVDAKLYAKS